MQVGRYRPLRVHVYMGHFLLLIGSETSFKAPMYYTLGLSLDLLRACGNFRRWGLVGSLRSLQCALKGQSWAPTLSTSLELFSSMYCLCGTQQWDSPKTKPTTYKWKPLTLWVQTNPSFFVSLNYLRYFHSDGEGRGTLILGILSLSHILSLVKGKSSGQAQTVTRPHREWH